MYGNHGTGNKAIWAIVHSHNSYVRIEKVLINKLDDSKINSTLDIIHIQAAFKSFAIGPNVEILPVNKKQVIMI